MGECERVGRHVAESDKDVPVGRNRGIGGSPLRVPHMRRHISRFCSIDTERGWGEGDSHVRLAVAVRGVTRGDSPNWFSNPVPFTIPLDIISVAREKDEGRVYEKSAGVFVYECRAKVETVMVHQKGE